MYRPAQPHRPDRGKSGQSAYRKTQKPSAPRKPAPRKATAQIVPLARKAKPEAQTQTKYKAAGMQGLIEKAYRAAGLMSETAY